MDNKKRSIVVEALVQMTGKLYLIYSRVALRRKYYQG